jgi:aryl-alcohol dehydrogenase-like predicted oxidoreductase
MDESARINEISAEKAGQIKIGKYLVNRIGFGAMRITGRGIWGPPYDTNKAKSLLRHAVDLGVNFIDTADSYGPGISESLIAEALFPYRGIVIATKGGLIRSGPGIWRTDCSPKHLRDACEDSLRRLKVDMIDIYQLHTVDPRVPFEISFRTLLDLQREGKIRHIGLSNIEPEHFKIAINMGGFVSVQNNYNLLNREHEDVLRLCEQHGITFIPYFPIGAGQLEQKQPTALREVERRLNASWSQIALAWLLDHSPNILPIPGTGSRLHLEENIASTDIVLDEEEVEILDKLAANTT